MSARLTQVVPGSLKVSEPDMCMSYPCDELMNPNPTTDAEEIGIVSLGLQLSNWEPRPYAPARWRFTGRSLQLRSRVDEVFLAPRALGGFGATLHGRSHPAPCLVPTRSLPTTEVEVSRSGGGVTWSHLPSLGKSGWPGQ